MMKAKLLFGILVLSYSTLVGQGSFSNISFDGPEKYSPTKLSEEKLEAHLRAQKDKIRAFPSRLDYRYDYLNTLTETEKWNRLTTEVVALVNTSYSTDHNWIWDKSFDAVGADAEAFLLNTVQDFVFMLYMTDDAEQYKNIREISEAVLSHNSDHRDFMTYPAMTYAAVGEYDKALEKLHKAEATHRDDALIAILLAENYEQLGNTNLALSYYQKVVKNGEGRNVVAAKAKIERLEDKQ